MNVETVWYPLPGSYSIELDTHAILLGWDDGFGRPVLKLRVGMLLCWMVVTSESCG